VNNEKVTMQFNILAVDDIEANVIILDELLKKFSTDDIHVNVFTALSGKEGLKIALKENIQLVILDIQMPGMNGFEVAKFLKMNPKTKDILIIFLTAAFKKEEFINHGYEIGAIDYFTKPIEKFLFSNKIKLYLNLFKKEQKLKEEIEKRIVSERMLAEQSKHAAMGEMIGNIAHQWRQPLSSINSIVNDLELEILLDELEFVKSDRILETGTEIRSFTQHLSKTIDDFRDYLRTDREKEDFNIYTIIKESLVFIMHGYKNHNISINENYDETNICMVNGFKRDLVQVILNLLNNAKDALAEKEIQHPEVEISIKHDNEILHLSIEDNAGGVPENIKDRIFDPYFTTKHKSIGTGIGLYMSKKIIISNFQGNLFLKNTKKGAKFTVEFPYKSNG